ncbi:unnamed protein product [Phytophthora lilii]|uniref:Unnamed protein product n=1 Tax=Phytophthora lilii TaxID=2077276 RepID=A0A9W6YIV2_9STRA|nr:unnamed protein product [Phytophthora lilii]
MNRLVARLGDLADSAYHEPEPLLADEDDVSCTAVRTSENRQQLERLKEEVCEYRAQVVEDGSVTSAPSCKGTPRPPPPDTTERINVALAQLDELHAEMFQLKQCLVQENQSFRRHLESLVSQQMAHIREKQDNETERIHEEMDEIRSGMCGILKDMHRLKERTKYLVPSMARVGPRMSRSNPNGPPPLQSRVFGMSSGDLEEERYTSTPAANPHSTGYSITMATRQCQDELPHYEHGYDDDCYCPGVLPSQMETPYARPGRPRSPRSSNSSDDDNWRMFSPEAPPATGQRAAQPCESPHYSSRSSSISDRLSVYGGTSLVHVFRRPVVPCAQGSWREDARRLWPQWRFINMNCSRLRRRACGTKR